LGLFEPVPFGAKLNPSTGVKQVVFSTFQQYELGTKTVMQAFDGYKKVQIIIPCNFGFTISHPQFNENS